MTYFSSRKQPSVEELEADLAVIKKQHRHAATQYGEDSREAREAADVLRIVQRKVNSAKDIQTQREEEAAKLDKMSTAEIVTNINDIVPRSPFR